MKPNNFIIVIIVYWEFLQINYKIQIQGYCLKTLKILIFIYKSFGNVWLAWSGTVKAPKGKGMFILAGRSS